MITFRRIDLFAYDILDPTFIGGLELHKNGWFFNPGSDIIFSFDNLWHIMNKMQELNAEISR